MADIPSRERAAAPESSGATAEVMDDATLARPSPPNPPRAVRGAPRGSGAPSPMDPPEWQRTGLRSLVLGAIVTVLAPLGGFLGGTMVGRSGYAGLEPMFAWMFGGLAVGAVGAFVAFTGGLRWVRANRRRL